MRQRDYSSVVTNAKLLVNKLMAQAIGASFIYASSDGMLRAHGHPAIVDVLTRHQDEILQHEAWTFGVGNRVAVDPAAQMPPNEAILPQLDQPVNKISNKQLA